LSEAQTAESFSMFAQTEKRIDNHLMRTHVFSALVSTALLSACGSAEQPKSVSSGNEAARTSVSNQTNVSQTNSAPPLATSHGAPQDTSAQPMGRTSAPLDTSALDQKIEQAEAKAKAPNAAQTDRLAAAAAYLERANVFYNAGNPSLYKFALRDFRITLRYDPQNKEARAKQDQIVQIYESLGRPVPDLGNEP
jgi:hypothetical protein